MFSRLRSRAGSIWCNLMHESIMWPTHGHYECRICGRRFVAFGDAEKTAPSADSGAFPLAQTPRAAAGLSRA